MDLKTLQKVGLTEGESKVYLALLRLGQTTTGPIVKRSGVTTSKSYKILARLEEKGLASHVFKNKIKCFKAASPEKVLDLITKQYEELEQKKIEVEKIMPELVAYQKQIEEEHEAEIYYGLSGLDTLFNEQLRNLKKGEASYVIGITNYADYPKEIAEFFRRLQEKRDFKKVDTYFLLSENARGSFKYMENSKYSFVRHLPYASLVSVNIYQEITIIGIFLKNPILLKIKSKAVADNFIKYFKILWDLAKE